MSHFRCWKPEPEPEAQCAMGILLSESGMDDYAALHQWSVDAPGAFWSYVWKQLFPNLPEDPNPLKHGHPLEDAEWFSSSSFNFASRLLAQADVTPAAEALVAYDENGRRRAVSWRQLKHEVGSTAAALQRSGVGTGDVVAGFVANVPEAVIAYLACAWIGAVWTQCAPDFGASGVLDRILPTAPKVLIATDGYYLGGELIQVLDRVVEIAEQLPALKAVIIISHTQICADIRSIPKAVRWLQWVQEDAEIPPPVILPFKHPLTILYSSVANGQSQGIIHSAGGVLVKHWSEHVLHGDLRAGDKLFYYVNTGWMMWHWLVSGLMAGATIVLYDGTPLNARGQQLWQIVDAEEVTHFGASPRYFESLQRLALVPRKDYALEALRVIYSSGAPLGAASFDFIYQFVKADVRLSSIAGGTDVAGFFFGGNPLLPVYRGELQCALLGMNPIVVNASGHQLPNGERGELVCATAFPTQPLGFVGERDGTKLHQAYYAHFPGFWYHGDFAEITDAGGAIFHGRSDAVLKPGGVRIGATEIYRAVAGIGEIAECLAIGQPWQNDVRVVLFVRLQDGLALDDALIERIKLAIKLHATVRHVPAKVLAVSEMPRCKSGQLVALAVRSVILGEVPVNLDAVINPDALRQFKNRVELRSA